MIDLGIIHRAAEDYLNKRIEARPWYASLEDDVHDVIKLAFFDGVQWMIDQLECEPGYE